ncbi:hypothetical protein M407DRAFT_144136 [Tulasnella calospora MUT 4182]|uniref:Uncharacterized protein n=1 Tax=Tulasnella calospora MUT 4182 TaxID=1051891 RepID=A0A0C3MB38_9AGAM|nr:hypothetical protein M407DRAFT_144136 [Tulasnella calospora MUT 4182]
MNTMILLIDVPFPRASGFLSTRRCPPRTPQSCHRRSNHPGAVSASKAGTPRLVVKGLPAHTVKTVQKMFN